MNRYCFRELHLMYCIGMVLYCFCEFIFRGFTHFSMVLTGGLCAVLLHLENRYLNNKKLPFRCLMGALTITGVEYIVGILVNRVLQWNVWDYSDRLFNIDGQICPLFTVIWYFLSFPAFLISDTVKKYSRFLPLGKNSISSEETSA